MHRKNTYKKIHCQNKCFFEHASMLIKLMFYGSQINQDERNPIAVSGA